jgi:ribose/xylose/arabinose/galactoside ABC-type transport system permease subunit
MEFLILSKDATPVPSSDLDWLFVCLFVCLVGWLSGWLVGQLITWLIVQATRSWATRSQMMLK